MQVLLRESGELSENKYILQGLLSWGGYFLVLIAAFNQGKYSNGKVIKDLIVKATVSAVAVFEQL